MEEQIYYEENECTLNNLIVKIIRNKRLVMVPCKYLFK